MNDDNPSDLESLASAYLDDDIVAERRSQVAADAEIMARVAELEAMRERLRNVPPQPPETASTQLAAALAVFDDLSASSTDDSRGFAAPEPPVPLAARSGWRRRAGPIIGVAAGTIAMLGIGVGAFSLAGRNGDDVADSIDNDTVIEASGRAVESSAVGELPETNDGAVMRTAADSSGGSADEAGEVAAIAGIDGPATPETTTPVTPSDQTFAPETESVGGSAQGVPGLSDLGVAEEPTDVAVIAAEALSQGPTPDIIDPCEGRGTLLGTVAWRGATSLLYVELGQRRAYLIDLGTCQVLETADLP